MKLLINSIYRATEGEGIHIGTPQIFVRLQGCRLYCKNCDSKNTWKFDSSSAMELEDILENISLLNVNNTIKRVSITGGDPLDLNHLEGVLILIKVLKEKNYFINVEASGSSIVHECFDIVDFISFDFKTPSTGVLKDVSILETLNKHYGNKIQVKSVIETKEDFYFILEAFHKLGDKVNFPWCLTPAYNSNEEFPLERFKEVIDLNEKEGSFFRVIGQQHKWIYGPNKLDV
ncbi:MAG: 7-carboxy-7-deazaguanine synthase QueE [Bdellovibrionales bacterium]|nr:7-carboxy-7-deazaguanine synthase QueE [Bdellovibrionales bacterium]